MNRARFPRVCLVAGGILLGGLGLCHPASAQPPASCGPACGAGSGSGGCNKLSPGAIPAPAGTSVRAWMGRMSDAAEADDFVVYKHEWFMGGADLGPYGRYHLDLMAHRLSHVPFRVVLQPEMNEALNEVRRRVLIEGLARAGVPDAPRRVTVAFPTAEGLYGESAPRIYLGIIGGQGAGTAGGMRANTIGVGTLGGVNPR